MTKKKLGAKDRLIASARRKIKNREAKLAKLKRQYEEDATALRDDIANEREILKAFGVTK